MPNIGDNYRHRGSGKSGYPLGCEIIDRTAKGFKVKEIWPKNKTKTGFYNSMDFIEKDDPMNNRALWIKESKMTPKQEKYLTEKYIRPMVRKMLKETTFKSVKVTYANGVSITTSVNPKLTDDEIRRYFKVGSQVNIGGPAGTDKITKIKSVEIDPELSEY